ncbi:cation-transporting P-type ATPase [Qaidamihabitans albus]|uniref:cation-transporting P-type ATPase n=1 Tax=Qaidamihabitans albus TaxID=2795733 RepID=UPI0027DCB3A5|nr:cation-transporting P-type ATPase [Qaidamihabitans albus]
MATTVRTQRGNSHHDLAIHEVVLLVQTDPDTGLTTAEARERRARYGPNVLPRTRAARPIVRLLRQLHHPLIYVLLAAGAVTLVLGERVDSAVISMQDQLWVAAVVEHPGSHSVAVSSTSCRHALGQHRDPRGRQVPRAVAAPVGSAAGDRGGERDLLGIRLVPGHLDHREVVGFSRPDGRKSPQPVTNGNSAAGQRAPSVWKCLRNGERTMGTAGLPEGPIV